MRIKQKPKRVSNKPVFKFSCSECQCVNYPSCTYSNGESCEECMRSTDNGHRLNRHTGVLGS